MGSDFASYTPVTEDNVVACDAGLTDPGESMQLDFSKGWEKLWWNTIVLCNLYNLINTKHTEQNGWGLLDVSEEHVIGELWGQLKHSREAWALVQPRFWSGGDR